MHICVYAKCPTPPLKANLAQQCCYLKTAYVKTDIKQTKKHKSVVMLDGYFSYSKQLSDIGMLHALGA